MPFSLLNVAVGTSALRHGRSRILHALLRLLASGRFGLELLEKARVLVLPVTNCTADGDDALNAAIFDKTATLLDPLHFSGVIRLMVLAEFGDLSRLTDENST